MKGNILVISINKGYSDTFGRIQKLSMTLDKMFLQIIFPYCYVFTFDARITPSAFFSIRDIGCIVVMDISRIHIHPCSKTGLKIIYIFNFFATLRTVLSLRGFGPDMSQIAVRNTTQLNVIVIPNSKFEHDPRKIVKIKTIHRSQG